MNFTPFKEKAKAQLKIYSKIPRLAYLITILVSLFISIPYLIVYYKFKINPSETKTLYWTTYCIYTLVSWFVVPILNMAYFALIAKIAKQPENNDYKQFTLKDFFANFKLAGKGIGNYWWTLLWEMLWAFVVVIPAAIIMAIAVIISVKNNSFSENLVASVIPIILIIIMLPVMFYKQVSYCLNTYAIADNNETKVIDAMNISKAITKGYRGKLFCLYLSFIGWYIVEGITLGIAAIWIQPYINTTIYYYYRELVSKFEGAKEVPDDSSEE